MIEQIRCKLILKYTLIIATVLLSLSLLSYFMQKYNNLRFVEESLEDYLEEEVWEARDALLQPVEGSAPEVHKIASEADSFHNYTFWYKNGKLIHAEEPLDETIAAQLLRRLEEKTYKDGQIYHANMKSGKIKWYFFVLKQSIVLADGGKGEIFVLFNYTGMRINAKNYLQRVLAAAVLLALVSWLVGRYLVNKSISYISQSYEKQKMFVANASHELRTPLSVLMGYTELLEYRYEENELTRGMKQEIDNVSGLIDALLDLARFETGQKAPCFAETDAAEVARDCIEKMELACGEGKITLNSPDSVRLKADKRLLRQLIFILLDNALKYTPAPQKIEVKLTKREEGAALAVSDNGIGIEKKELKLIFERFYRIDKSHNANIKGSGVGLALADAIVRLHGGRIEVASIPGKGSTFTVIFPG